MNAARDPYRYFRIEARELLDAMGSDLLSWSRGADEGRRVELLRHAHTLKGAARVVKQPEIARNAHELEDLLAESVDAGEAAEVAARGLALVDRMRALLEALDQAKPDTKAPSTTAVEAPRVWSTSAVRLDLGTADAFLEQVRRAGGSAARGRELTATAAAALRRIADHVERLRAGATDWSGVDEDLSGLGTSIRAVHAGLEAQSRELADLDEAISEVRLVSLQDLGKELEQLAYATAGALGKRVDLVISGAEIRVDAGIVAGLRTALRHVVQNAVAHGIEPESRRLDQGKPATGRIAISFRTRAHRVHVECEDDGVGIDEAALRRALLERGMHPATQLQRKELLGLLFSRGFTTAKSVDEIAGRGVGLDIVAATVAQLRGEIDLDSTFGVGTIVRLVLPSSLVSSPALGLAVGHRTIFVPLDSVARALLLKDGDVTTTAEGERVVVDGAVVPFAHAARLLGSSSGTRPEPARIAIVLRSNRGSAALGVSGIGGVKSVVVRNLPERYGISPFVAGVALNAEGQPDLVLAPIATIEAVRAASPQVVEEALPVQQPILVIDDSLTTRMLEKSILESAGYDVDVATSAEQAIEMARRRRYGLFLVDVEMPGMDGFGFVAFARDDPELAGIPAILVTSRSDDEDKRRGMAAGARAYVVKGEFDQRLLLETIGGLLA